MPSLPPSVARWYDPFVSLFVMVSLFLILTHTGISDTALVLVVVGAVTLVMCAFEWARVRPTLAPGPGPATTPLLRRVIIKWTGVMTTVLGSMFLWWLIPFYTGAHYKPLFTLGPLLLPWFAVALIPYLFYTEWRLGEARDYAWNIGLAITGTFTGIDWKSVRDGALSMLVRTVFLPLNTCFIIANTPHLRDQPWHIVLESPTPQSHALILMAIYAVLIVAIIPGYLFSFRLLGTHTRAVDRSWFGWMVTLSCYPPLLAGVFGQWFAYNKFRFEEPFMKPWIYLFSDIPALLYAVGFGIIAMELVHWLGEAILGIRSSNLTHRGIITNGVFKPLRHPVYLSKCIGWFLIFCPFMMADTTLACLRNTLLFGGVCLIYYLRAIAEERMLSVDSDYVAYATHLDQHGWLAFLGRRIPVLTFAWRHTHWHTKNPLPPGEGRVRDAATSPH